MPSRVLRTENDAVPEPFGEPSSCCRVAHEARAPAGVRVASPHTPWASLSRLGHRVWSNRTPGSGAASTPPGRLSRTLRAKPARVAWGSPERVGVLLVPVELALELLAGDDAAPVGRALAGRRPAQRAAGALRPRLALGDLRHRGGAAAEVRARAPGDVPAALVLAALAVRLGLGLGGRVRPGRRAGGREGRRRRGKQGGRGAGGDELSDAHRGGRVAK